MKTQKELSEVLDQLRDAYIETDEKGMVTYVNQPFVAELGFDKKEDVIGHHFQFLVQREFVAGVSEQLNTLFRTHQAVENLTTRFRGKNGRTFIGEAAISPVIKGGVLTGTRGTIRNMTHRLESEKEVAYQKDFLDALLQQAPVSIVIIDKEKKISHVNPAFQKLFGYTREEVIGKNLDRLLSSSGPLAETTLNQENRSGEPLHLSCQRMKKNGTMTDVEVFVQPFFAGSVNYGYLVFYNDISERVKAQAELASINLFAEKISHSLNLKDIFNTIGEELMSMFPIKGVEISLLDNKKAIPELLAFHSAQTEEAGDQAKILDFEGSPDIQGVISSKKILLTGQKPESGSRMIVPLVMRGRTLGLLGMAMKGENTSFDENHVQLAETLASQVAAAVDNALLYAKTEAALDVAERDLEIGREIQAGFFPQSLPEIPGWELATYFKAARQVSGDFYDAFPLGKTGYFGIVVADVCDKGVGAALFMVLLRSLIRSSSEQCEAGIPLADMISQLAVNVNGYIVKNHGQSNMFATLVLAILDPASNNLYYVNGGHDSPLWIDSEGHIKKELEPTGPAFGFSADLSFEYGVIELMPGDLLLFYTDGFTEARDMNGRFYSDKRLHQAAARAWTSALSAIKQFEFDVFSHIGDQVQLDDLTMLALRRSRANEALCHQMTQGAELAMLPGFRNFVEEACLAHSLDKETIDSLKLVVDELCSNLILHGYKDLTPGDIQLTIKILKDIIELKIKDHGHPFDPSIVEQPNLSGDIYERKVGGLGVFLVKELADEIYYESGREENCLTLKIKYEKTE